MKSGRRRRAPVLAGAGVFSPTRPLRHAVKPGLSPSISLSSPAESGGRVVGRNNSSREVAGGTAQMRTNFLEQDTNVRNACRTERSSRVSRVPIPPVNGPIDAFLSLPRLQSHWRYSDHTESIVHVACRSWRSSGKAPCLCLDGRRHTHAPPIAAGPPARRCPIIACARANNSPLRRN